MVIYQWEKGCTLPAHSPFISTLAKLLQRSSSAKPADKPSANTCEQKSTGRWDDIRRWQLKAVAVQGNIAYIGLGPRLVILDVSDPARPREVGSYDTPRFASGLAVAGSYAYVADEDSGFLILRFLRPQ